VRPNVHASLEKAGFNTLVGENNICSHINIALKRAHELVGTDEPQE
jgi:sulfate permease, SulP family